MSRTIAFHITLKRSNQSAYACLYVCVTVRATKPAFVGEGAAGTREEAEATGGGFWETG